MPNGNIIVYPVVPNGVLCSVSCVSCFDEIFVREYVY